MSGRKYIKLCLDYVTCGGRGGDRAGALVPTKLYQVEATRSKVQSEAEKCGWGCQIFVSVPGKLCLNLIHIYFHFRFY
jgi:hypothetical protein